MIDDYAAGGGPVDSRTISWYGSRADVGPLPSFSDCNSKSVADHARSKVGWCTVVNRGQTIRAM